MDTNINQATSRGDGQLGYHYAYASAKRMQHPMLIQSFIQGLLFCLPTPSVDAFAVATIHHKLGGQYKPDVKPLNVGYNNSASNAECFAANDILTSAIIKCAYDGTYFRGWTAGNSDLRNDQQQNNATPEKKNNDDNPPPKRKQTRRSRTLQRKGGGYGKQGGRVRTVDDTIRFTLAKVYGNIDANRITIEACSRTDAGVHAHSLVAQFYCAKTSSLSSTTTVIARPNSHYDTSNFLPLPFGSDLSKLVFVLNRMLPPDVRVLAASPLPLMPFNNDDQPVPFHPALHTMSKTYMYKFAIGYIHDPLQTQYIWHLDGSSSKAVGMNGKQFRLEHALAAANLFVDASDETMTSSTAKPKDYGAFRSAFRGTDRGRIQSTICKLWKCKLVQEKKELLPSWEIGSFMSSHTTGELEDGVMHFGSRLGNGRQVERIGVHNDGPQTFTVIITGDRFLYKMIRNIVGTIVAVGCGHLELDDVRIALDTGKWDDSGGEITQVRRICAPARGLTLVEVKYPPEIGFDWHTG